MKEYRITDSMSITLQEDALCFNVGNKSFCKVSDDDTAQILNILISMVFSPRETFSDHVGELQDGYAQMQITFKHSSIDEYSVKFHISDKDDTSVTLTNRWEIVKLMNILTMLLPKICETGEK